MTLDRFLRDELMQHGIMRLVEILGEAARHLSDDFKTSHPEIPNANPSLPAAPSAVMAIGQMVA